MATGITSIKLFIVCDRSFQPSTCVQLGADWARATITLPTAYPKDPEEVRVGIERAIDMLYASAAALKTEIHCFDLSVAVSGTDADDGAPGSPAHRAAVAMLQEAVGPRPVVQRLGLLTLLRPAEALADILKRPVLPSLPEQAETSQAAPKKTVSMEEKKYEIPDGSCERSPNSPPGSFPRRGDVPEMPELDSVVRTVVGYARTFGSAPDFASMRASAVRSANNYICHILDRALSVEFLEIVRGQVAWELIHGRAASA